MLDFRTHYQYHVTVERLGSIGNTVLDVQVKPFASSVVNVTVNGPLKSGGRTITPSPVKTKEAR